MATPLPNEIDRAYAAGFFDGEGTIRAGYEKRKQGLYFQVCVSQVRRAPLLWLQKRWGGGIYLKQIVKSVPCFVWVVGRREGESFLKDIKPYVIVKTEEVELALEFCSFIGKKPGPNPDIAICLDIAKEMQIVRHQREDVHARA